MAGSGEARMAARVRLVVPAYREGARLPAFGEALVARLGEFGGAVELRVVDDGSGVAEAAALAARVAGWGAGRTWVRPALLLAENQGKGGAVYAGWDAEGAGGEDGPEWLGFCDADGSVAAEEVARLIAGLADEAADTGAVVASRLAKGARCEGRSVWRGGLGRIFAAWVRMWTGVAVRDSQCGCKFVRAETYRRVRGALRERRFAFDAELLAAVVAAGEQIREVPVEWRHREGGTLRVGRDGWAMLVAVAGMRGRFRRITPGGVLRGR